MSRMHIVYNTYEVSLKGFQRNFILGKKQRFMIAVYDSPDGTLDF